SREVEEEQRFFAPLPGGGCPILEGAQLPPYVVGVDGREKPRVVPANSAEPHEDAVDAARVPFRGPERPRTPPALGATDQPRQPAVENRGLVGFREDQGHVRVPRRIRLDGDRTRADRTLDQADLLPIPFVERDAGAALRAKAVVLGGRSQRSEARRQNEQERR